MKIKVEIEIALKKLPKDKIIDLGALGRYTFDELKNEVYGVLDEMISPDNFLENMSMYENMDDIIDYDKSKVVIKEK